MQDQPTKKRKTDNENTESEIEQLLKAADDVPATVTLETCKQLLQELSQASKKNEKLRMKYSDEPLKFIDSEADLVESVLKISRIGSQFYKDFCQMKGHVLLLHLLQHENTDVVIAVLAVLNELTDDDAVDVEVVGAIQGIKLLLKSLVEGKLFSLIASILDSLDESIEDDLKGNYDAMSLIENMVSIQPDLSELIVKEPKFIEYVKKKLTQEDYDSNLGYSVELLAILLQNSEANRKVLVKAGILDLMLPILARYRKSDPSGAEEMEYFENVFDCICCIVESPDLKQSFLDAQGMELMIILLKSNKLARLRALKVIDHVFNGSNSNEACNRFIDLGGISFLFGIFMSKPPKKEAGFTVKELEEHSVSIIASLFQAYYKTETQSRLVFKFIENDFEKLHRLLLIRLPYASDSFLAKPSDDDEEYLNRLDSGLYTLQMVNRILLYLCACDDNLAAVIPKFLAASEDSIDNVLIIFRGKLN